MKHSAAADQNKTILTQSLSFCLFGLFYMLTIVGWVPGKFP